MANYKIRLQIIATANDDGTDAANITANTVTGYLPLLNQIMSPAQIEFVFDPVNDFLKISSTLLNRDFTPMEKPNVGTDKWDHEPEVDSDSHSAARTSIAMQFRKKLVVIYRKRKKLDKDDDGNWYIANKGGGSSSAGSYFVNMSTSSNAIDLGHEIGERLYVGGRRNNHHFIFACKPGDGRRHREIDRGLICQDGAEHHKAVDHQDVWLPFLLVHQLRKSDSSAGAWYVLDRDTFGSHGAHNFGQ